MITDEQLLALRNIVPLIEDDSGKTYTVTWFPNGDNGWEIKWHFWCDEKKAWVKVGERSVPDEVISSYDPYW